MRVTLFALALAATSAQAEETPGALSLLCGGGGSANKATTSSLNAWNSYGDSASATISGSRSVGFEDQVSLRIAGDAGQVRMPRTMLPPIHGGSDGWFKLKDIKYSEGEITASVSVNFMNNPKLRLD